MSFELRPYQLQAIENTIKSLETHRIVGGIAPTSSGKTEVFAEVIKRHLDNNINNRVLILSHLGLLVTQTKDRLKKRINVIPGVSQAELYPSQDDRVIVSTMQSTRQEMRSATIRDSITLIIIDECHYLMTESYNKILNYFKNAKVFGCTATPFRSKKLITNYFEDIAFSYSLQELIDQGWIVPPVLKGIKLEHNNLEERIALVASLYNDNHKGKKAVVYMDTIENALIMRNGLISHGIKAKAVTSKIKGNVRDVILTDFRENDEGVEILTTVNVLTQGFDSPNLEVIFQLYKTNSPTVYMQRIGRGLRLCPSIGKKCCYVYTFGNAPTIERKFYEKLTEIVLKKGRMNYSTIEDSMRYSYMKPNSEIYKWTKEICELIKQSRKYGAENIAQWLNERKFPDRFMQNPCLIAEAIDANSAMPHAHCSPTDKQHEILKKFGYPTDKRMSLTRREASILISMHLKEQGVKEDPRFIIPSGRYQGKHIAKVPYPYLQICLRKYPDSSISKIWKEYKNDKDSKPNTGF